MALLFGDVIYRTVNFCLRAAQPEFFRRIRIEGEPLDDPGEYLIVVANHPYGIQDAFLVSYAYTRPFYYVATAMNFQRREGDRVKKRRFLSWFLTQCKVLPIVRDRREGHMSDNVKTFEAAANHIAGGHALGIFAEGDSRGNQWKLLKLKAGAAEIALRVADTLSKQGAKPKIQVVGLTYTNWDRPFKSSVTLRFARPFVIEPVAMTDKAAVRAARREITGKMTELMGELTVRIEDEHQGLAGQIGRFYMANSRDDYVRLKTIGQKLEQLAEEHADARRELEQMLDEYLSLADELKIYPGEERSTGHPLLLLLAAIPVYVGYVIHWPILWATRKLVPLETTVLHALGSKQVSWGIVLTLALYAVVGAVAVGWGVNQFGPIGISYALGAMLVMAVCGLASSRLFRHVNMLFRSVLPSRRRFRRYRELGRELYERLEQYRSMADAQVRSASVGVANNSETGVPAKRATETR